MKKVILIILALILLSGCGNEKDIPSGVSEQFYDQSVSLVKILENRIENAEPLNEVEGMKFDEYLAEYMYNDEVKTSKEEHSILLKVFDVQNSYEMYKATDDLEIKTMNINRFKSQLKEVKELLNI